MRGSFSGGLGAASSCGSALGVAGLVAVLSTAAACGGEDQPTDFVVAFEPSAAEYQGFESLSGTVTLPREVPIGTRAVLALYRERPQTVALQGSAYVWASSPVATSAVKYNVRNLAGGGFFVFLGVDLTGDMNIGSGDLAGFYKGTAALPASTPDVATQVGVDRSSVANFGVGPYP